MDIGPMLQKSKWVNGGTRKACLFYRTRRRRNIAYYNRNDNRRPKKRVDPINENIRYPEVRVIGPDGQQLGVMSSREANELALQEYGLDLFCVAPQANPPVCKILNYGKYRFEKQKSEKEARKNQRKVELKQVQLTPQIGQHDLDTKARHAREFLEDGNRVEVCVIFRGRQMAHKEVGEDVMQRFCSALEDVSVVDKEPFWEGKWYKSILAPKKK